MLTAVGYASAQSRVRARRARLLQPADWGRLVAASDETRAAALVTATRSTARLEGEALPRALRWRVQEETLSLARTVPRASGELLRWYAHRTTVQDLKVLIRALHHQHPVGEALGAMTGGADAVLPASLRDARSVPALIAALRGTPFGHPLEIAAERYRSEGRTFYLEVALDLAYLRGLVAHVKELRGSDRSDADDLLGRWIARSNLLAAGRYRALRGVSPEEVVNFCLHRDLGGGLAMVQRVAAGGSLHAEAAALGVTLPAEVGEREALSALEREIERLRRDRARRRLHAMPFGLGFVLAYIVTLEAETSDLITLLEAKAQGLDADALLGRLLREVDRGVRA